MGYFTFLKLRLKGLSIRKPFQAEYQSIYIIVQDFNLAIVLGILRYETLSKRTIRLSPNTYILTALLYKPIHQNLPA